MELTHFAPIIKDFPEIEDLHFDNNVEIMQLILEISYKIASNKKVNKKELRFYENNKDTVYKLYSSQFKPV